MNADGLVLIDLAGLPALIDMSRRLHRLRRELDTDHPPRTMAEVAKELGSIITEFEVRK